MTPVGADPSRRMRPGSPIGRPRRRSRRPRPRPRRSGTARRVRGMLRTCRGTAGTQHLWPPYRSDGRRRTATPTSPPAERCNQTIPAGRSPVMWWRPGWREVGSTDRLAGGGRRACPSRRSGPAESVRRFRVDGVQMPTRSSDRFREPARSRGRSGRDVAPPTTRTVRRSPGPRGWAASRPRSRSGFARSQLPDVRSARSGSYWRPLACCDARRPRTVGTRGDRRVARAESCPPARRPTNHPPAPPTDRAPRAESRPSSYVSEDELTTQRLGVRQSVSSGSIQRGGGVVVYHVGCARRSERTCHAEVYQVLRRRHSIVAGRGRGRGRFAGERRIYPDDHHRSRYGRDRRIVPGQRCGLVLRRRHRTVDH